MRLNNEGLEKVILAGAEKNQVEDVVQKDQVEDMAQHMVQIEQQQLIGFEYSEPAGQQIE